MVRRWMVVGLVVGGCGSDTALETAFCDLLENGPATAVTAATSGGPEGFVDASRVDVALLDDGTGTYAGEVVFTPDEVGSFVIGLSDDVPIALRDAAGTVVPLGAPVSSENCGLLAVRYTVDLEVASYALAFGPTTTAMVSLVAEESDDDR